MKKDLLNFLLFNKLKMQKTCSMDNQLYQEKNINFIMILLD